MGYSWTRTLAQFFYQDAYICILIYDKTSKKSFDSLKEYWHKDVKEGGSDIIIFHVAGNKKDLFYKEEVERNDVKDYCNNIEANFSFISATQNAYIDDLFWKIAKKFINSDFFKNMEKSKEKPEIFSRGGENDSNGDKTKRKKDVVKLLGLHIFYIKKFLYITIIIIEMLIFYI